MNDLVIASGPSLLLVEDDKSLAELVKRVLESEGYRVEIASDGHRGLHLALTRPFDVLVVDRGLPAIEGLDLVMRLRAQGIASPMLILSARGTTQDKVEGLDAGAEDYLTKPFEIDELLARLRALLRRNLDSASVIALGDARFDLSSRTVTNSAGKSVMLSDRESALLATLAARPGRVFSRSELLSRVFGDAESETVVDTYVHYCRRKLGKDVIRTVRGLGYTAGSA